MVLTGAEIRAAKPAGKACKLIDGVGMFLLVHPNGFRYWRLRYRIPGKKKTLVLGVYPEVSLSETHTRWGEAQKLISEGTDPCEQKRVKKVIPSLQLSFEHIARRRHANNEQQAQSHSDKVFESLETHVFPLIGDRDITTLSTPGLLIPVRATEAEQIYEAAGHLQQGISAIMRYAVQSGITGYSPALDMAGALTTVEHQHYPALDLSRLPEFLSCISSYKGQPVTRLAVMLNLLVFTRSSELRYTRWSEIDIDSAMWTIPVEHEPLSDIKFSYQGSKMQIPHLVPLSKQAVAILTELQTWTGENGLIFMGAHNPRKSVSEDTVNKALRAVGYDAIQEVCDHGFRAMVCNALIGSGLWSRDAVERQMSHQERNSVCIAYTHKAGHLEERRLIL